MQIRKIQESDYAEWSRLYHGYASFYKVPMNDEILGKLWSWIHDPEHEVIGFIAIDTDVGGIDSGCGLAHIRQMPSPLRGGYIGFLDDLFVDPAARGKDVGKQLFSLLEQYGREQGWPIIRWITADDNYRARGLYDQLSSKTLWNTYQMDL